MESSSAHTGPDRRRTPRRGGWGRAYDALYALLRWIGRHTPGFHTAIGTFLAIGLGTLLLLILAFGGIAGLIEEGRTQRFDEAVLLWINAHASPRLDVLALEATALGSGFVVWMIVLVASAFLWVHRNRYSVALLWTAFVGGGILNGALKMAFDRPRPRLFEWGVDYAGQSSFPSGHSMTAMVVYATLAYLLARLEPSRGMRRLTLLVAAFLVLVVGLSRLYLGVHYPSDVLAGYVVGLAWATFCVLGIEAVRYFRHREPRVAERERGIERGATGTAADDRIILS